MFSAAGWLLIALRIQTALSLTQLPEGGWEFFQTLDADAVRAPLAGCSGPECVEMFLNLPDDHYKWQSKSKLQGKDENGNSWSADLLTMTSQQWLEPGEVSPQVWEHPLTIIEPEHLKAEAQGWTTLIIGGVGVSNEVSNSRSSGSDSNAQTNGDVASGIRIAVETGARVAVLGMVPVQKLRFKADLEGRDRQEDEIKAFTWRQFIDHQDRPEFPIELPMLKAVVRAMDTVMAFTNGTANQFIATGCSKRGMASVMAGAFDKRVKGIAPCVISLDSAGVIHRLEEMLGEGTGPAALQDYVNQSIPEVLDTPEMEKLMGEIDPSRFLERLDLPILWLSAGRDDFFPPDHTQAYWNQLPSTQKSLVIDGNQIHIGSLSLSEHFLVAVGNFVKSLIQDTPAPQLRWSIDNTTGRIQVYEQTDSRPRSAMLWQAMTCGTDGRRDFRRFTLDPPERCVQCGATLGGKCAKTKGGLYTNTPLESKGDGLWEAQLTAPKGQYVAFYLEFEFDGPTSDSKPWMISTEESVVPREYPFAPCQGKGCKISKLVF
eukprot:TRINITY_DN40408_c0_g1_i2.p1 TRINITY_DN40408_c0_g1~~TRINITY_DN40408_c0_g1_i2.p1  ORF type:complete len:544 (+),score=86.65 TRINITY_DN40408_c0_g1_i2:68-1699(+)